MWNWIDRLIALQKEGLPFAIVTVVRCEGSTPRNTGAKMLVARDGRFWGTVGGGYAENQVLQDVKKCLETGRSGVFEYPLYSETGQVCGGSIEMMVEVMNQNPVVYIFGAGHVGKALAHTLAGTLFEIHLIDERPEWIGAVDLPGEVHRHKETWQSFLSGPSAAHWDATKTFIVIMTYTHDIDYEILQASLGKPFRYLGVIGSENKRKHYEEKLTAAGFTREQIQNIHCPIGLPIGGKAPQEIAISVSAELLKHYHGK